jgi:hypothetical protein
MVLWSARTPTGDPDGDPPGSGPRPGPAQLLACPDRPRVHQDRGSHSHRVPAAEAPPAASSSCDPEQAAVPTPQRRMPGVVGIGQLLLLECVHGGGAGVLVTAQLPVLDEVAERCLNRLLTGLDVVILPSNRRGCHRPAAGLPDNEVDHAAGLEHLLAEREEAGVDEQVRLPNRVVEIRHSMERAVCRSGGRQSDPAPCAPRPARPRNAPRYSRPTPAAAATFAAGSMPSDPPSRTTARDSRRCSPTGTQPALPNCRLSVVSSRPPLSGGSASHVA